MPEVVILVDENDVPIGTSEKMEAHQKGKLHRAFSIFIFNSKKLLLLQQRASSKYHSANLWTNTCCSHPRPNEDIITAAHRKLQEEMGFDCDLKEVFSFKYKTDFGDGLIEHEWDHVVIGNYDNDPILNPEEAENYKWVDMTWLKNDIENNPENYTSWLKICLEKVIKFMG